MPLDPTKLIGPEQWAKTISYYKYPNQTTKGFLTYITPDEFLSLTTKNAEQLKTIEEQAKKLGAFDITKFQSEHLPYLDIDKSGKVTNHEGRHRAQLLKNEGVSHIPVVISTKEPKANLGDIGSLKNQFGVYTGIVPLAPQMPGVGGGGMGINSLIPLY